MTPGGGNVTFAIDGLGSDEVAPVSLNPGESLTWAFFEEDLGALTNPGTVTGLEIWFEELPGFGVDVTAVDGSGEDPRSYQRHGTAMGGHQCDLR